MKIRLTLSIISLTLTLCSCGNKEPEKNNETNATNQDSVAKEFDVRTINWDMTAEQVKKSETAKFIETQLAEDGLPFLIFEDKVMNENATLMYFFTKDDKISRLTIAFEADPLKGKETVDKYFRFSKIMTEKYGTPTTNETKWLGTMFKQNDTLNFGLALYKNQVTFTNIWQNASKATIVLSLANMDETIMLTSTYVPTDVAKDMAKEYKDNEKKGI